MKRSGLSLVGNRGRSRCDDHIVVFVHGILSDSRTFEKLLQHLVVLDPNHDFDFWAYDYDYLQSLAVNGDRLANAISAGSLGSRRIDIVGHSMGGLVARMAVLRNKLPNVARIITLATPNHGTISGAQISVLWQMTTLAFRRLHPIYARKPGILDLTNAHVIMRDELRTMYERDATRLEGKSYVSIPAQYFHSKRQMGDTPPSIMMGGVTLLRKLLSAIKPLRIMLTPVHDGIVEERSNQLHPAPIGSSSEGAYMPTRTDADERILHVTHEAAADCDHITVTACPEIADLINAVLRADDLKSSDIDPLLDGPPGRVALRPTVG